MRANGEFLQSVLEEHLNEAEFLLERFEALLSAADFTLDQVAQGFESRLLAHVDALAIGGEPVATHVLLPVLQAKEVVPARATAVVLALLQARRTELAAGALQHESTDVRGAAVRAFALAADSTLDSWIRQGLATRGSSANRVPLLELAAERGISVPWALESLHSEDPSEIVAALRMVHGVDPMPYERRVLELFEHPAAIVRQAAIMASLHHGSMQGWDVCRSLAFDPNEPNPLAMALVGGLGEPAQHTRLAEQVDREAHHAAALRALGYSGNVAMIPLLVFHTHSKDEQTAKLAAEAIATIAGDEVNVLVPPKQPAKATGGDLPPPEEDEDAKRSLPPLEEDDLDADLVPPAEAALATLDSDAVSAWWTTARTRFDPMRRYLGGVLATRGAFAQALTAFPMRRRYLLSLLLSIRTGGAARVSTRAFSATQRAQIRSVAAETNAGWVRHFGSF